MPISVREANAGDVRAVFAPLTRLFLETGFLLREPGEYNACVESEISLIEAGAWILNANR